MENLSKKWKIFLEDNRDNDISFNRDTLVELYNDMIAVIRYETIDSYKKGFNDAAKTISLANKFVKDKLINTDEIVTKRLYNLKYGRNTKETR